MGDVFFHSHPLALRSQSLNKPRHALFVLVILTQGLYLRILFVQLWTRFSTWREGEWGGKDFLLPLVFNMLSHLWLLSRWFTSLLTLRWCEFLPLTVDANTTWKSSYRRGEGYRELQFPACAQSTQEIFGENPMVGSLLQALHLLLAGLFTTAAHWNHIHLLLQLQILTVLLHTANFLMRIVSQCLTRTHLPRPGCCSLSSMNCCCGSLTAQCRNAWNVSVSRYLRDPSLGNACTSHRSSPPAHCLSETVTVGSLFSPPRPTQIKIFSPAPVLTPAPICEAKSSWKMKIPQISNIPVSFQTCCRSGYNLGRQAAFRGWSPP